MFRICSKLTVNTPERRQLTTIGVTRKIPSVKLTPGEFPPETPPGLCIMQCTLIYNRNYNFLYDLF